MAAVDFLPDEIVLNILARLPAKPLLRFRCVSKYWRCMLMDPYFMKLRARKSIILHINWGTFDFIDGNVSTNDSSTDLIFQRCYPFKQVDDSTLTRLIGSFNGLVLMLTLEALMLYNPFTGESKKLPDAPTPIIYSNNGYGFGYGDTPSDLKIVKLIGYSHIYEVYDFKRNLWSSRSSKKYGINYIMFQHLMGTFVNGYLYWIKSKSVLIACSVKDMVLSDLILPSAANFIGNPVSINGNLCTINGCLCLLKMTTSYRFELWVRKEHMIEGSWVNTHSFTLQFEQGNFLYHILIITDGGEILMLNTDRQLIIYNISKGSYETLKNISTGEYIAMELMTCSIQYMETLVSPLDVCFSRLGERKKNSKKIKRKTC